MRAWGAGAALPAALLTAVFAAAAFPAAAAPLTSAEVLNASSEHFPRILERIAERRAAAGVALESQGAFDLVFDVDSFGYVNGFYDGIAAEGTARQRMRPLGATLYGGYKISEGDFPIYQDIHFTNTGGTVKVGMLFSLLRDRDIDEQRFRETDARLGLQAADLDVLLARIGVQQNALVAYWRWVAAGRQLAVFEDLLRIAIERQTGLEEQVRRGARAAIFLTENQQNITRRRTLVTSARRDRDMAANALSMFYRDGEGNPTIPGTDQVPPAAPLAQIERLADAGGAALSDALTRRPELALLRNAIERERNRIALRENALKPRLDMHMEVQSGLGAVGEGGISRDSTDTIVGLDFSVPLQQRGERGRLMRSRAQLEAKRQQERLRTEQIELEVRNLLLELRVARDLLLLAAQEVEQTEIMRDSERRRFQSGASDFFLVNVREETAANARIRLLEAELQTRVARANYDAATVDLDRLGIAAAP